MDIEITEFPFGCQLLQRCSHQSHITLRTLGNSDLLQVVKVESLAKQKGKLQSAFQHSANVQSDDFRQSALRVVHLLRRLDDPALKLVKGLLQNLKEQVLLAGDVVIESRFGQADRLGNVAHDKTRGG
mgnify:CR=1 FL=1